MEHNSPHPAHGTDEQGQPGTGLLHAEGSHRRRQITEQRGRRTNGFCIYLQLTISKLDCSPVLMKPVKMEKAVDFYTKFKFQILGKNKKPSDFSDLLVGFWFIDWFCIGFYLNFEWKIINR
jgi:hypothetical protein